VLTLVHGEIDHVAGVSRQGGSGIGGGVAAGRHRAIPQVEPLNRTSLVSLECAGCRRPLTDAAVFLAGKVYCGTDCVQSLAVPIPGLYFG
jgi:hypothetical protein